MTHKNVMLFKEMVPERLGAETAFEAWEKLPCYYNNGKRKKKKHSSVLRMRTPRMTACTLQKRGTRDIRDRRPAKAQMIPYVGTYILTCTRKKKSSPSCLVKARKCPGKSLVPDSGPVSPTHDGSGLSQCILVPDSRTFIQRILSRNA